MNGAATGAAVITALTLALALRRPTALRRQFSAGESAGNYTSTIVKVAGEKRVLDRVVRAWRRRGRAEKNRADVVEMVRGLAAELRAGAPAPLALLRAADSPAGRHLLRHAAAAARYGGSIPDALRQDADAARLLILGSLAALWEVTERSGAGMAAAADRLAASAAAAETIRHELASQLAGPKASARVLAGLPVLGVLLGSGLGASPVSWLLGSPVGLVVLVAGIGLEVLGLFWVTRLVRSVESLL
ncbi:MAG: type II secretion system F family protein [Candidatus Nanopelagicales bacterium]|nr:type II secretion system F family protein [Candidatus Nanopelagicales bacterium]